MAPRVRSLTLVITASPLEVVLECARAYISMADEEIDYYIYAQMYFFENPKEDLPITTMSLRIMSLRMRKMGESGACGSTIAHKYFYIAQGGFLNVMWIR
jgi:hypothetical protein